MRDPSSFSLPDEATDAVSGKDIATATGNEPEVSEFPDSRSTSAFTGTDIVPDPEVGDPPDGGIKRVPHLAIGNEVGLGVGEPPGYDGGCIPLASGHKDSLPLAIAIELGLGVGLPPGDGGGCTPSVSGLKAGLEVGEPPGGHKRVPFLAIDNKLSLEVGEPPGYGGGYTSSVFGLKADPKEGEPPGNGPTPLLPDCGLFTTPSSGFSSKSGSGA